MAATLNQDNSPKVRRMIDIGHRYLLTATRRTQSGVFVDAKNLGEILLPNRHAPSELRIGEIVDVFLYLDSDDRPIATTQKPCVEAGEFAYLNAIANTDFGTFLDWGLDKDLLVPFAEQHRAMITGQRYLVYVYVGKLDGRIAASSKIEKFLDDNRPHTFKPGQPVSLIIANSTDLGFKAIINHSHWGVLYKNEVLQKISFGQQLDGHIKYIRPDGKIDLSLNGGQQRRDKQSETIITYLERHGGIARLHDKSPPELIMKTLGMSKKAFKKAIGGLYKQRRISIETETIRLVNNQK